jgi:hypothetical protein
MQWMFEGGRSLRRAKPIPFVPRGPARRYETAGRRPERGSPQHQRAGIAGWGEKSPRLNPFAPTLMASAFVADFFFGKRAFLYPKHPNNEMDREAHAAKRRGSRPLQTSWFSQFEEDSSVLLNNSNKALNHGPELVNTPLGA